MLSLYFAIPGKQQLNREVLTRTIDLGPLGWFKVYFTTPMAN